MMLKAIKGQDGKHEGYVFEGGGVKMSLAVFDQCCDSLYLHAGYDPANVVMCKKDFDVLEEEIMTLCGSKSGGIVKLVNQATGRIIDVHIHPLPRGTMYFGTYRPEWYD